MRLKACLALVLGVLLAGATTVAAGWEWNARLTVEGATTQLKWGVVDGGDPADYRAQMRVWLPEQASVELMERLTEDENVVILKDKALSCRADGVEVRAQVRVLPVRQAAGSGVTFRLVVDGVERSSATGSLNEKVEILAFIPTDRPACFSDGNL